MMMPKQNLIVHALLILLRCGALDAFHIPRASASHRWPTHSATAAVIDDDGGVHDQTAEHEDCAILEGTSPKAIRLRKQVEAIYNNPGDTHP